MKFLEWVSQNYCGFAVCFIFTCFGIAMILRAARGTSRRGYDDEA